MNRSNRQPFEAGPESGAKPCADTRAFLESVEFYFVPAVAVLEDPVEALGFENRAPDGIETDPVDLGGGTASGWLSGFEDLDDDTARGSRP